MNQDLYSQSFHIPLAPNAFAIIPFPMTDDDYHLLTHSLELWHKRLTDRPSPKAWTEMEQALTVAKSAEPDKYSRYCHKCANEFITNDPLEIFCSPACQARCKELFHNLSLCCCCVKAFPTPETVTDFMCVTCRVRFGKQVPVPANPDTKIADGDKVEHQPAPPPGPYCGVCCKPFVPKPHESQTLCQSCSTF